MLLVLAAMNTPCQGLPNFIVYLYPMILKAKKQVERQNCQEHEQQDNDEWVRPQQPLTEERNGEGEGPATRRKCNLFEWIRISLSPSMPLQREAATTAPSGAPSASASSTIINHTNNHGRTSSAPSRQLSQQLSSIVEA